MNTPNGVDPCPYCGRTTGVQSTPGTPPRVEAWSCTACGTDWAVSVVNPHFLDQLAATVELAAARKVLRQVIVLATASPALTDDQLRDRLAQLATRWHR